MKRFVYTLNLFYLFGLTLWVGGMFLLGFLVEKIVRDNVAQPVRSITMNKIMDVFNVEIVYTCIGLMVAAEVVKFLVKKYSRAGFDPPQVTKRRYVREVILGVMIVLAIYMGSFLRPEMHEVDRMKKASPANQQLQIRFNRGHWTFVNIYMVNMILGLSLLYIHGKEMARFRECPADE